MELGLIYFDLLSLSLLLMLLSFQDRFVCSNSSSRQLIN